MHRRKLNEAEKNMLTCAALMTAVGVGLIIMSKISFGVGCIIFGVVFAVAGIVMYCKSPYETEDEYQTRIALENEKKNKKHKEAEDKKASDEKTENSK